MSEVKICEYCGTACGIGDLYCKKCSQLFLNTEGAEEQVIEGITNSELERFIGKNAGYYLEKFEKAKHKKVFCQINVPALLFGPSWFFYRKMYKLAIIYAAILIVLSSFLTVVLPAIFEADIDHFFDAQQTYNDYVNAGGEVLIFKEGTTAVIGTNPTFRKIHDDLVQAQNKIKLMWFFVNAPVLIVNFLFRLLGNWFYKKHIMLSIGTSAGGTSGKSAFLGWLAVTAVTYAVSALLLCIPVVLRFTAATENLYLWM